MPPESATLEAPATPHVNQSVGRAFEALDAIGEPAQAPAPTPAPTPAPAAVTAPSSTTEAPKPAPTPRDDIDDLPKPRAKPATPTAPAAPAANGHKPGSLEEFRAQHEMTKKERDSLRDELKTLKEAQETGTKKEVEAAKAELAAELDKHRKRADELETEVKFLDYSRSGEFKEKYHAPLTKAWKAAIDDIQGATITEEDGITREATANDILNLTQLSTTQAAARATEMFGAAASEILAHRRRILDISAQRDGALGEWRTKGSEREAESQRNTEQSRAKVVSLWENTIKEETEANRELFAPDEKDPEGNEFLKKGDALIKIAFTGQGLREGLTPEQRTELITRTQARVATRAMAFGRERHRNIQLQAKVEELTEKLKGYEKSEPGAGVSRSDNGANGSKSYKRPEDALDDM